MSVWAIPLFSTALVDREALQRVVFSPFRPGVERALIYETGPGGPSMAYLRYQPGARVPLHRHDGYEQILVLEGEQADEDGSYPAGTIVVHAPGTEHRVFSESGCVVLAIWEKGVTFVEPG